MGKQTKRTAPRLRGRPNQNLQRRSIGLSDEDWSFVRELGVGCITGGIREAIKLLRKGVRKP